MSGDSGWHYGPTGEADPGFIEGTAHQPDGIQDHMDAWGNPHPGDLGGCLPCRIDAGLPGVTR
ncbi:hypothetical protein OG730_34720 [Streptomyces sp. NBC_01298]|uniref:hypothetical protein n=1 Tax=Streptomyces sp. NBC_01298 TaxID=2903817 RepID=UPI002E0E9581|nr:hypothetical protein OG730_34720 [Streptomyces sp. NBC_01298]